MEMRYEYFQVLFKKFRSLTNRENVTARSTMLCLFMRIELEMFSVVGLEFHYFHTLDYRQRRRLCGKDIRRTVASYNVTFVAVEIVHVICLTKVRMFKGWHKHRARGRCLRKLQ